MSAVASPDLARKRVFIVDDHPVFREGLVRVIEQSAGLTVCGEASDAEQALLGIDRLHPDLVLLDLGLPGKGGLELLQSVHAIHPEMPVLVVSMHEEDLYAERVLRAGGRGYVMKQEPPDKLIRAMSQVLSGKIHVSDHIGPAILDSLSRPRGRSAGPLHGKLTDREVDILRLTGLGKDCREIATELQISAKTVDTHRAHLREKLHLKSNTELIHYAVRWVGDRV